MPIYRAWLVLKKGFERVIANIYCNHGWEFLIDVIKNYVDLGSLSLKNQTSWSSRSAPPKVTGLNVELNLGLPKQTSKLGFTLFLRIRGVTSRVETSRYRDFSQFFESISLGLENILSRKKVSVSVSKTLVSKKVLVSVSKILVSKKVSVTT